MATKIAINGFGRIGRMFYRALMEKNMLDGKVEVVAINDIVSAKNLAYLLKYDSTQGNLNMDVRAEGDDLLKVGPYQVKTLALKALPAQLPWRELGIDIVVESTGLFTKKADAHGHIEAGAKKVLISAPSEEETKTLVMGVNETSYLGEEIVSNASCTTNCLTPLVHVLMKEGIGIDEGLMTTNHSYTASQVLMDGPSKKDFREGRAAAINIIPTTTGAAKAVGWVFPELKGKLSGTSFRVPTPVVSVIDLTFRSSRDTSLEEINSLMKKASDTYMQGILGFTDEAVVSSDFIHNSLSSIYDSTFSMQLNSRFFKLIAWYDNEWGYSCRLADVLGYIAS